MDRGLDRDGRGDPGPRIPGNRIPADFIFLLRPMILIPVWTFFLLGVRHGSAVSNLSPDPFRLATGIAAFTAMVAAAYILNQITDRETDRLSGKLFLISHGVIDVKAAWTFAGVLAVAAAASAVFLMPLRFVIVLIAGGALGAAYSLEPVRLKRRPVLDLGANSLANGILNTLAGWTAAGAPLEGLSILAPYPLAVAAVHLSTTLADIEGDRLSGLRTSGVALGPRGAIVVSTVLMAASLAAAAAVGNAAALYASLASLPFFIAAAARAGSGRRAGRYLLPAKVSTAAYSVAAGIFYPAYLPLLVLVVLATRLYYSRRFGIEYPSL